MTSLFDRVNKLFDCGECATGCYGRCMRAIVQEMDTPKEAEVPSAQEVKRRISPMTWAEAQELAEEYVIHIDDDLPPGETLHMEPHFERAVAMITEDHPVKAAAFILALSARMGALIKAEEVPVPLITTEVSLRFKLDSAESKIDGLEDEVRELKTKLERAIAPTRTVAAQWRVDGEPDPHGHTNTYDGERSRLMLGKMTDDELANAAFMNYDVRPSLQEILSGKAYSPIAYMTAVKERIRWLSRALVKELDKNARFKLLGETRENGVNWFDQNPHAYPVGTTFYCLTSDSSPTNKVEVVQDKPKSMSINGGCFVVPDGVGPNTLSLSTGNRMVDYPEVVWCWEDINERDLAFQAIRDAMARGSS